MRLAGQTALVTGAASGISRAIAEAFAAQGATVICADVNAAGAQAAAAAICSSGGHAIAVQCDVTRAEDIDGAVQTAIAATGRLDIVLNGAGIMVPQSLMETTLERLRATFEVNVFGLLAMIQAAGTAMIAGGRGGRIINIASIAGRVGSAGSAQYCASKAAVISITQSAAQSLARHGITVNALAPGYIETPMWHGIRTHFSGEAQGPAAAAFDNDLANTVACGRLGTPADITGTALFLASADAAYVIGQTINIDGGAVYS